MKVLVLAGGDSGEREVSLNSGKAVCDSLKRLGHVVFAIDPASGKALLGSDGQFIDYKRDASNGAVAVQKKTPWSITGTLGSPAFQDIECVVITLHGGSGENGTLQCLLDLAGKKYTGSGMAASAIAMDKAVTKRICQAERIKTAPFLVYDVQRGSFGDSIVNEIKEKFQLPVIVKPNDGGSTIGLTKVENYGQLRGAFETASRETNKVLVEQYIRGREITAAILEGKTLPLVEIRPKSGLYDYESKYTKGKTSYIVPAEISEKTTEEIQTAALRIYEIIGAAGLARADFILDEQNEFYFLELNTLPGMTALSLAPMAANAVGINFDDLINELIKAALKR